MKVLMKKDLRKVGKKGDIVEVSDGYGANYLIPNGYAVLYNDKAKKDYANEQALEAQENVRKTAEARELAARLEGITLEYEENAGRNGDMIGTVSFKEILQDLKKNYGISIDKKQIADKNQIINGFGKTRVKVELFKSVYGYINVHVSLKEKK